MARFLIGQEFTEVCGMQETFIKERALPVEDTGISASVAKKKVMGKSTVDDALLFLARFSKGAIGSFEATRLATGNKNGNQIEINGEKGSIYFNFERMNELFFYDSSLPKHLQGWTDILATSPGVHPYYKAWWPDGHLIGYEHTFINIAADIMRVLGGEKPEVPLPDFADALRTQQVLEAALVSAEKKTWVKVSSIK